MFRFLVCHRKSLLGVDGLSHLTIFVTFNITLRACMCMFGYESVVNATYRISQFQKQPQFVWLRRQMEYSKHHIHSIPSPFSLALFPLLSIRMFITHKASSVFSIQYLCYEYCIFHLMRFITRLHWAMAFVRQLLHRRLAQNRTRSISPALMSITFHICQRCIHLFSGMCLSVYIG